MSSVKFEIISHFDSRRLRSQQKTLVFLGKLRWSKWLP